MKKLFNISGIFLVIGGSVRCISYLFVKEKPIILLVSTCCILVGLLFIFKSNKISQKFIEFSNFMQSKSNNIIKELDSQKENSVEYYKFYKPEKLISRINNVKRLYKTSGFYKYENTFFLIFFQSIIRNSIKSVMLENNYITFQFFDNKEEKYDLKYVDIKYRITVRYTAKTVIVNFHFLVIGKNFEKWISSAPAHNIEYQALVYFIYFLKNNELEKINTLDTDFLRC